MGTVLGPPAESPEGARRDGTVRRAGRTKTTEDWAALDDHLAEVAGCRLCPRVQPPPVTWRPEAWPRLMLVGQAPGPREPARGRPFAFTAGTRLFSWFARLGAPEAEFRRRVYIAAVLRCFPGRAPAGGDRVPAPDEIANCAPYLERELELIRPATVIAVGQLAIARFLPVPAPLGERVGRVFTIDPGVLGEGRGRGGGARQGDRAGRGGRGGRGGSGGLSFELVPLPHPSGRSTWLVHPGNQALLDQALTALAATRGWRETFGGGRRRGGR